MKSSNPACILQWNMASAKYLNGAQKSEFRDDVELLGKRKNILKDLVLENSPSLVALQEAPNIGDVLIPLGFSIDGDDGLVAAFRSDHWTQKKKLASTNRIKILLLKNRRSSRNVLYVNIHAPSKLYGDECERDDTIRIHVIDLLRTAVRDCANVEFEILVAGDFNKQPYDNIMLERSGLNARRSIDWVSSQSNSSILKPLFNPAWRYLGHHDGIGGTYCYTGTNPHGPWYVFDQVLLSKGLIEKQTTVFKVISATKNETLLTPRSMKPKKEIASDHLPALTTLHNC